MNSDEIRVVLEQHKLWLNTEGGKKADLRGADLRGADLQGAGLQGADLEGAALEGANLGGANLREADLREADLREADLLWADLRGVDLRGADLRGADLRGANLRGADLREADLRGADLDISSFPLWCGGAKFKCGPKLIYQLLAHVCTLDFDDSEGIKELILPFARKSHRAKGLGLVDEKKASPIKKAEGEE